MATPDPPISAENLPQRSSTNSSGTKRSWDGVLKNRWAVLGMLFFVTAALGLPLLWISPVFSRAEKWIWSLIVTLYTFALLLITGLIMWWSYSRIAELLH